MKIVAEWSSRFKNLLNRDIVTILDLQIERSASYNIFVKDMYEDILRFLSRGRSLGPILALAVYVGYRGNRGSRLSSDIVRIASAIEFYSFSVLLHDDVIDCDTKRIRGDTFHKIYESKVLKYAYHTEPSRFGRCVALLAGNILHDLSFDVISASSFSEEKKSQIINTLNNGFKRLNESQLVDLHFENIYPSSIDWYIMASQRAAHHVMVCMSIGGIGAEFDKRNRVILQNAAENIGYMYDIRDDLFDTFKIDKKDNFGRDIRMKKKPLHLCYALENAQLNDREKIIHLVEQKQKKDNELIRLLRDYGLNKAFSNLKDHGNRAKGLIRMTGLSDEAKTFFNQLIDEVIQKTSRLV